MIIFFAARDHMDLAQSIHDLNGLIKLPLGTEFAVEDDNRACHRLMKKAHDLLADPASGKEQVHG